MFSHDRPRAWKIKNGHSRLEQETNAVATAQAKGNARESIERVVEQSKSGHGSKTETV